MGINNFTQEIRLSERRKVGDRRKIARFSDELGRRLGVERRLPIKNSGYAE
jgi:hypothetical protein